MKVPVMHAASPTRAKAACKIMMRSLRLSLPLKREFSAAVDITRQGSKRKYKDRKFVDWKRIVVKGGTGGNGCVSFRRSGKVKYGPADGGNGGRGGGVIFVAHPSVRTLKLLNNHYHGNNGTHGQGAGHNGRTGRDVIVQVPLGTAIKDSLTGTVLADLLQIGDQYRAVGGGEGGLGNFTFADVDNRRPVQSTLGGTGEETILEVEIRTIADVGLVGFPNAGKSTLLRAITRATPTVADYPFTTLNPQVGVVMGRRERIAVADIPGLIPGAHKNRGLGHSFLRHIERCTCLLYVLDITSPHFTIEEQYDALQLELQLYNPNLLDNVGLVLVNKMDIGGENSSGKLTDLKEKSGLPVIPVSGQRSWNMDFLKEALFRVVSKR